MAENRMCWKCGASIEDLPFPLSRMAKCASCQADLHVCRLCRFYDTSKAHHCQEPIAEPVKDKQRANFCELFQVRANAYHPEDTRHTDIARQQLAALFGNGAEDAITTSSTDQAKSDLNKLFGIEDQTAPVNTDDNDNTLDS